MRQKTRASERKRRGMIKRRKRQGGGERETLSEHIPSEPAESGLAPCPHEMKLFKNSLKMKTMMSA